MEGGDYFLNQTVVFNAQDSGGEEKIKEGGKEEEKKDRRGEREMNAKKETGEERRHQKTEDQEEKRGRLMFTCVTGRV